MDPKTKAEVEGLGDGDSWTYDELMLGRHLGDSDGKPQNKTERQNRKWKKTKGGKRTRRKNNVYSL